MASEELDRTNGKVAAGGSGMDLIFNKLEALQQEIKDEQAEDDKWIKGQRAKASQSRNSYLSAIKALANGWYTQPHGTLTVQDMVDILQNLPDLGSCAAFANLDLVIPHTTDYKLHMEVTGDMLHKIFVDALRLKVV